MNTFQIVERPMTQWLSYSSVREGMFSWTEKKTPQNAENPDISLHNMLQNETTKITLKQG